MAIYNVVFDVIKNAAIVPLPVLMHVGLCASQEEKKLRKCGQNEWEYYGSGFTFAE